MRTWTADLSTAHRTVLIIIIKRDMIKYEVSLNGKHFVISLDKKELKKDYAVLCKTYDMAGMYDIKPSILKYVRYRIHSILMNHLTVEL